MKCPALAALARVRAHRRGGPDAQLLQWDVQAHNSLVVLFNVTGNKLQLLAI